MKNSLTNTIFVLVTFGNWLLFSFFCNTTTLTLVLLTQSLGVLILKIMAAFLIIGLSLILQKILEVVTRKISRFNEYSYSQASKLVKILLNLIFTEKRRIALYCLNAKVQLCSTILNQFFKTITLDRKADTTTRIFGVNAMSRLSWEPTQVEKNLGEFYLRHPETGPKRGHNLLKINNCAGFVKDWEGTPIIENAINFERKRLLYQHPQYTFQNNASSKKAWTLSDKQEQDAYLKTLHYQDLFNHTKVRHQQQTGANWNTFVLNRLGHNPKKFTEGLLFRIDFMESQNTGQKQQIASLQDENFSLKGHSAEAGRKMQTLRENIESLKLNLSETKIKLESEIASLKSENLGLKGHSAEADHNLQALSDTIGLLKGNLLETTLQLENQIASFKAENLALKSHSAEADQTIQTLRSDIETLSGKLSKITEQFEAVKMENPYLGLRPTSTSVDMWKVRMQIEKPLSEHATAAEIQEDDKCRATFIRYVYRDAFKLYFNTTSQVPLDTKLPPEIIKHVPAATKASVAAMGEFLEGLDIGL